MHVPVEKHPPSLGIFFATEMWERYGFYVVQSLLTLYLASSFKWSDKEVYTLVGSFTALTYLSPLAGGWIADTFIGQKKAIILGALILFFSYCLLSFMVSDAYFIFSLAGIAVGTGLLKPNISSLLGNAYPMGSSRRESGFTIFYMGITSGIILGTTLPTQLNTRFGWIISFRSAAVGMIISLAVFIFGIMRYKIKDYHSFVVEWKKIGFAFILTIGLWCLFFYILQLPRLANGMFGLMVLVSMSYIFYSLHQENANQSRQTIVIGLLCLISMMFWAFYFQMFMSLTLFISRVVEPTFCGILFPPPYYITIQSIGMLIIGFFFARKKTPLSLIDQGLSANKKFLFAMLCMTFAYLIIAVVSRFGDKETLLSPLFIVPAFLIISLAELLLSPVGLSTITLLACKNKVSTMMGIFFVSLGTGGFLSGKLASLTLIPSGEISLVVLKDLYAKAFIQQCGILLIASLACLFLFTVIKVLLTPIRNES